MYVTELFPFCSQSRAKVSDPHSVKTGDTLAEWLVDPLRMAIGSLDLRFLGFSFGLMNTMKLRRTIDRRAAGCSLLKNSFRPIW